MQTISEGQEDGGEPHSEEVPRAKQPCVYSSAVIYQGPPSTEPNTVGQTERRIKLFSVRKELQSHWRDEIYTRGNDHCSSEGQRMNHAWKGQGFLLRREEKKGSQGRVRHPSPR